MAITREKVLAALEIANIPTDLCWGKPEEFVKRLVDMLSVTLELESNNDFVVIGFQVPSEDDKNRLWIRTQRNGSFQGFYLFVGGKWQRVENRRSDEIVWFYGDSRSIPDGYQLVDAGSQVPVTIREHLQKQYLIDTTASGAATVYSYFACIYVGL